MRLLAKNVRFEISLSLDELDIIDDALIELNNKILSKKKRGLQITLGDTSVQALYNDIAALRESVKL